MPSSPLSPAWRRPRYSPFPVIECRLVFENDQEPAGNGFSGTDRLDQIVVVLLQFPAFGILLIFHVTLDRIQVLADICFLG